MNDNKQVLLCHQLSFGNVFCECNTTLPEITHNMLIARLRTFHFYFPLCSKTLCAHVAYCASWEHNRNNYPDIKFCDWENPSGGSNFHWFTYKGLFIFLSKQSVCAHTTYSSQTDKRRFDEPPHMTFINPQTTLLEYNIALTSVRHIFTNVTVILSKAADYISLCSLHQWHVFN